MKINQLPDEHPQAAPFPIPVSRLGRIAYGFVVTILPILGFFWVREFAPSWQSGQLSDHVALFLSPRASWAFFPLIAYSSIALLLLLADAQRYAGSFWVRLGVYAGAVLAFQYVLLVLILIPDPEAAPYIILIWIAPFIAILIYRLLANKWGNKIAARIVMGLLLLSYLWLVVQFASPFVRPWQRILDPLYFLGAVASPGGPFWALLIMSRMSLHLLKQYETRLTLARGLGLTGWLSMYVAAWRYDILKMHALYTALPTEPPDCYIASAAARGHTNVVGSRVVQLPDGRTVHVNPQLQRLKSAELALLALAPGPHKFIRTIYDVLGRALARRLVQPGLSDAAYFSLKPFEWAAVLVLRVIMPEFDSICKTLYVGTSGNAASEPEPASAYQR